MISPFIDYTLPTELIAQQPLVERDRSRLLVVRRSNGTLAHHAFHELPELLQAGDLLVLNDTSVVPARLLGRRARSGGKWEGLFLRQHPDGLWEMICQTRGRLIAGETIDIEPGPLRLELVSKTPQGHWLARPRDTSATWANLLQRHGRVPLPPYIRKGQSQSGDRERYQTVYARQPGAVAAPTAGLHFTPEVLARLDERGIHQAFVTLHVGLDTFQPIQAEDIAEHKMHAEWGEMPAVTAEAILACRARGDRVVAVGTTSARLLETVASSGAIRAWSGETDLFIRPPYTFTAVDVLLTNFHLPRSTLLLLVGAFAGDSLIRQAYQAAIDESYRFYSYGDAMLIV